MFFFETPKNAAIFMPNVKICCDGHRARLEVDGEPCAVGVVPSPNVALDHSVSRAGVDAAKMLDGVIADFVGE